MKLVISLKSTDAKLFEQTFAKIVNITQKRGNQITRIRMPTKSFTVPSGYRVRIKEAMISIRNPDDTLSRIIKESLDPIAENLDREIKVLKSALALNGKYMTEEEIKKKLETKILIEKGF
jgi:ribosomal protein S10